MTIVVTWFKDKHYYMFADAAITDAMTGNITNLNQLKLIPHPKLNAGISWYGRSKINGESTTLWIRKILETTSDLSLYELAKHLETELNKFDININSGIHIAGYEKNCSPVFCHVTNNHKNNLVNPDVKNKFIQAGFTDSESIPQEFYVVNGVGFGFKIIIESLKNIKNFEDYLTGIVENVKYNFYNESYSFNFQYDDKPRGFLNKILFYLHIAQWLHLYSEQPDFIGGKYSTMIISKLNKEFDPNGNSE